VKPLITIAVLFEVCNGSGEAPASPGTPTTLGTYRQLLAGCWTKLQKLIGEKRNEQNGVVSQRQEKRANHFAAVRASLALSAIPAIRR
jgi:hypothetical protein